MYVKAQIKRIEPATDKCTCSGGMGGGGDEGGSDDPNITQNG